MVSRDLRGIELAAVFDRADACANDDLPQSDFSAMMTSESSGISAILFIIALQTLAPAWANRMVLCLRGVSHLSPPVVSERCRKH